LRKEGPSRPEAACFANLIHSKAFSFISLPFFSSINTLTRLSTLSLLASSISNPISHSLQVKKQLVCCSAKKGQHIIGTPTHTLSNNPPIAGWASTSSCGHQLNIKPLFLVCVTNSGGRTAFSPATRSGLITHTKVLLLLASPHANSINWSLVITSKCNGPMEYTGGKLEELNASKMLCSNASNVFNMIAEALSDLLHSPSTKSSIRSSGFVVLKKNKFSPNKSSSHKCKRKE
ncbi:hypothetical protein Lal_00030995, partial [Lupinus albus]